MNYDLITQSITNYSDLPNFVNFYDNLNSLYLKYNNERAFYEVLHSFLANFAENGYQKWDYPSIIKNVHKLINEDKYYHHQFNSIIFNSLLDQNLLKELLNSKIDSTTQSFCINDFNYNYCHHDYKVYADRDCNFYLSKNYVEKNENNKTDQNILLKNFHIQNDQTTKFIVHATEFISELKIVHPYYPNQNLNSFLCKNLIHNDLSITDKLVIILELLYALKTLDKNGIYHQSLTSSAIFIDNNKDAYIGDFICNRDEEAKESIFTIQNYYRHPELLSISDNREISNNAKLKYDIYSLGVIIYEIITRKDPKSLFKNEKDYIEILSSISRYLEFLFQKYPETKFDDVYGIKGIRMIIESCMKGEFQKYDDIIKEIEEIIKENNCSEIVRYRINNAACSDTYKCKLSDIVLSYYEGNETSYQIIKCFHNELYKTIHELDESIDRLGNEDIITAFYKLFEFENDKVKNNTLIYDELFDSIIKKSAFELLDREHNLILDKNQKKLMSLSINANIGRDSNYMMYPEINDITNIIPITTLDSYLKLNQNSETMNQLFLYILAVEIAKIHSNNIYHGELSKKSIGIYYNYEMKSFVPSIISFYYFYKHKKIQSQVKTSNDIQKMQQKDIKSLINIIQQMDETINIEYSNQRINDILFILYNRYINNPEMKKLDQYINYKSFGLNFSAIDEICNSKNTNIFNDFLIKNKSEAFIDIESIIHDFENFSYEKLYSVKINEETQKRSIQSSIEKIKDINETMLHLFYDYEYHSEISQVNSINFQQKLNHEIIHMAV